MDHFLSEATATLAAVIAGTPRLYTDTTYQLLLRGAMAEVDDGTPFVGNLLFWLLCMDIAARHQNARGFAEYVGHFTALARRISATDVATYLRGADTDQEEPTL